MSDGSTVILYWMSCCGGCAVWLVRVPYESDKKGDFPYGSSSRPWKKLHEPYGVPERDSG